MYLRLIISSWAMTSMTSAGSAKQILNSHRLASRTGNISYAIDMVVATIWSSSSHLSNPVFLSFPTKGGT